jgi:prepilin-type N-terminal cleavage/methylation domain-containing protein
MKRLGFTVIEFVVALAILLIIARWVVVFAYGPQLSAWERSFVESLGVSYAAFQLVGTVAVLAIFIAVAIRQRLIRRRKPRLEIPL